MTYAKARGGALIASLAAAALLLAGCAGGGSPAASSTPKGASDLAATAEYNPQPRDNIKDGGSLTTATVEITPQFNSFQADGTAYTLQFWRWYNPVLALFDADGTYHPNPDYLTDVKKEEKDGKTVVTYTINPKAFYNDGDPIDWKSFEATWKANSGQDESFLTSSTDGYSQIESVTQGADERQAVVTFQGTYAWVDGLFNLLLNPKAATPDVFNQGYVNNPHAEWGAGPYTVDTVDQNNGVLTFKRNDKWWGDKGKLDARVFKVLESSASINAFKAGETDATSAGTQDRLAQVKDMKDVDIRRSATPANTLMVVNSEDPNLGDLDVRTAIMKAIDRKTLGDIEFQGLDYSEDAPGSFSLFGFQPGYEDNFTDAGLGYDKDAAEKLLDEAGWKAGDDGVRAKDGKKLTITLPVLGDDPTSQAEAKALVSMLKDVGVDLTLDQHPSSDFSDVFTSKKFGIFLMAFSSSDPYGFAYFCQMYCSDSSLNASGTGTPEFDKKIEELTEIGDPDEQIAEGNKLEAEIFKGTAGIMPFFNGPTIVATKKGLANYGAGLFYVGKPQDIGWEK